MKTGFWPIDVSQFETASTDYRREKERRSFQLPGSLQPHNELSSIPVACFAHRRVKCCLIQGADQQNTFKYI
ncbi:hypothetical protein PC129_g3019 [Phytophthora cactorum]|uniref:Uncharacterized protein n=1 Tax=Phytophthora cactorum TaxID=29920 RepID=A0A8T1ED05_9STRA|nr:hypothetical protein Pcac1_g20667 [Phytophthora cactorum]KAG2838063.1 hypothetical protein PC112_g4686 [Phytophthora cactorum]KAG2840325.1 hypothetical protein PC111_g3544 [Phytophthora cactorum]KAG2920545.1 hypothetical protein PC114_g6087 [Phytophthora cactorum]KAG2937624.1 hypothetical protein PC115_g4139 [Phytophthora cactorum]